MITYEPNTERWLLITYLSHILDIFQAKFMHITTRHSIGIYISALRQISSMCQTQCQPYLKYILNMFQAYLKHIITIFLAYYRQIFNWHIELYRSAFIQIFGMGQAILWHSEAYFRCIWECLGYISGILPPILNYLLSHE